MLRFERVLGARPCCQILSARAGKPWTISESRISGWRWAKGEEGESPDEADSSGGGSEER
jgi:hypothetical protein